MFLYEDRSFLGCRWRTKEGKRSYETHRSDGFVADRCSCYHSLDFTAVLALFFFPWLFLLGQWRWSARDGKWLPSVPRDIPMSMVMVVVRTGWIQQPEGGEAGAAPMPQVPPVTGLIMFPAGTLTWSTPTHHIYTYYTPHIYIHTLFATEITDTQRAHRNAESNDGLILLHSLSRTMVS